MFNFLYVRKFIIIHVFHVYSLTKSVKKYTCIINAFFFFFWFAAYFLNTICEIIIYIQGIKIYITQILNATHWGWVEWMREFEDVKRNVNEVNNGLGSCRCYDVPLDSSWLVSLTEEVSASFIISWRGKKHVLVNIAFIIA